jgi:hypothetical protein
MPLQNHNRCIASIKSDSTYRLINNDGFDHGNQRDRGKKYVVRLSKEERAQLQALIRKGRSSAKQQLKARILLKADMSGKGEGWSDSQS